MSDSEYSVIKSDVIKSFDCTLLTFAGSTKSNFRGFPFLTSGRVGKKHLDHLGKFDAVKKNWITILNGSKTI